jgi:hypothetical protein
MLFKRKKKKTEHQIQITKSWTQSCKKAWQETKTGQGRAGQVRAAKGKKKADWSRGNS